MHVAQFIAKSSSSSAESANDTGRKLAANTIKLLRYRYLYTTDDHKHYGTDAEVLDTDMVFHHLEMGGMPITVESWVNFRTDLLLHFESMTSRRKKRKLSKLQPMAAQTQASASAERCPLAASTFEQTFEQTPAWDEADKNNIAFKPGTRAVTLQGNTHNIEGGYWECKNCGAKAGNKNALSSLCIEGNCINPNTQKAEREYIVKPGGAPMVAMPDRPLTCDERQRLRLNTSKADLINLLETCHDKNIKRGKEIKRKNAQLKSIRQDSARLNSKMAKQQHAQEEANKKASKNAGMQLEKKKSGDSSHLTPQGGVALALRRNMGNVACARIGHVVLEDISHQTASRWELKTAAAIIASARAFNEGIRFLFFSSGECADHFKFSCTAFQGDDTNSGVWKKKQDSRHACATILHSSSSQRLAEMAE